eukprot:13542-Hanusia_phi.AAC.1
MVVPSAAYGATMLGSAAMNNVWVTYSIPFFSSRLSSSSFFLGQALYMIWNALNDPLIGWLSDMSPGLMRRRIPAIQYGGPLWALVFALSWLDWGDEGQKGSLLSAVHFTLALFAYDGLLTLVELNHGALLAARVRQEQSVELRVSCRHFELGRGQDEAEPGGSDRSGAGSACMEGEGDDAAGRSSDPAPPSSGTCTGTPCLVQTSIFSGGSGWRKGWENELLSLSQCGGVLHLCPCVRLLSPWHSETREGRGEQSGSRRSD